MTYSAHQIGRTPQGALKVLDLLEKKGFAPIVNRQKPYWNPPVPAALRTVLDTAHVPALNWRREVPEGVPLTDLDAVAAFLSAGSSATFAHGALTNTGPYPDDEFIRPGMYLVDVHHWGLDAPGSPLGAQHITTPRVWVTHVTYRLLRDLAYGSAWSDGGHWPDATAYDSWTSETSCRFTKWTNEMRDLRSRLIDAGDGDGYAALKLGYSQAVQMWKVEPDPKGTPKEDRKKHNEAYRPDWYATLHAQHAANLWRRAYIASIAGHPPVIIGGTGHQTDGMAFRTGDLTAVLAMPKPPITLDPSGKRLGTFRQTRRYFAGQDRADGSL